MKRGTRELAHVFKNTITVVSQQERRFFVFDIRACGFDLLIDVAVHQKQIQIAIIVVIKKLCSPPDK